MYRLAKYVARILRPLFGHTDSFIKNSYDFVKLIKEKKVDKDYLITIFCVLSLLNKIPLNDVIQIFYEVINPQNGKLAKNFLCSTFFNFQ